MYLAHTVAKSRAWRIWQNHVLLLKGAVKMRNSLREAWIMPFKWLLPDTVALPMAFTAGVCMDIEMSSGLTGGFSSHCSCVISLPLMVSAHLVRAHTALELTGEFTHPRRRSLFYSFCYPPLVLQLGQVAIFSFSLSKPKAYLRLFWWLIGKLYSRHCTGGRLHASFASFILRALIIIRTWLYKEPNYKRAWQMGPHRIYLSHSRRLKWCLSSGVPSNRFN